ncbi:MliC family protein [Paracoccus tegillarcae]|nr:MliC family protein [Paracoccus tegillarcae]
MSIYRLSLLLTCLAAPAAAMSPREATPELLPVTYRCDGGVSVPVVFLNPPQSDAGYASTVIDGKLMVLTLVRSASGARYRSDQTAPGYQIWVKGDEAMITKGPETADTPVAQGCRVAD